MDISYSVLTTCCKVSKHYTASFSVWNNEQSTGKNPLGNNPSARFKFNFARDKKPYIAFHRHVAHQMTIVVSASPLTSTESIKSRRCAFIPPSKQRAVITLGKQKGCDKNKHPRPPARPRKNVSDANRIYLFAYTLEMKYSALGCVQELAGHRFSQAKNGKEWKTLRCGASPSAAHSHHEKGTREPFKREFLFSCSAANLAAPNMKKISTAAEMAGSGGRRSKDLRFALSSRRAGRHFLELRSPAMEQTPTVARAERNLLAPAGAE
jgi:hypothetical protein